MPSSTSTSNPQHLGFRAAALLLTAACITLVVLLAQLCMSLPARQPLLPSPPKSSHPSPPTDDAWCAFGTLPGTWVSTPSSPSAYGTHWQLFSKTCPIQPLLNTFLTDPSNSTTLPSSTKPAPSLPPSQALPNFTVFDPDSASFPEILRPDLPTSQSAPAPAPASSDAHTVNIIFISDSIDRHVLTYLCQHVQGVVRAIVLKEALPLMPGAGESAGARDSGDGDESGPARASASASSPPQAQRRRRSTSGRARSTTRRGTPPAGAGTPNNLAAPSNGQRSSRRLRDAAAPAAAGAGEPPSGYVVNTCSTPNGRLRLLASYIPGVHPSGPFHKQRQLSYAKRIDHAAAVWRAYTTDTPDVAVVSSTLWDLARASRYEPALVLEPELPRRFLDGWAANYSAAVRYAQAVLPQAKMWAFHTTIPPQHDPVTGVLEKSYLGQANHIRQLNAAGWQAALELGMEVMDYAAVASRFQEGQAYLTDQIHPNREVGLELANLYLNYCQQLRRSGARVAAAAARQRQQRQQ